MLYEPTDKIMQRIIDNIQIIDAGYHTPCYQWTGGNSQQKRGNSYARLKILNVTTAVHLYLWKRFKGPIKKKYQIDHVCNNTLCIRLDHLQMVTHLKNQRLRAKRTKERILCVESLSISMA